MLNKPNIEEIYRWLNHEQRHHAHQSGFKRIPETIQSVIEIVQEWNAIRVDHPESYQKAFPQPIREAKFAASTIMTIEEPTLQNLMDAIDHIARDLTDKQLGTFVLGVHPLTKWYIDVDIRELRGVLATGNDIGFERISVTGRGIFLPVRETEAIPQDRIVITSLSEIEYQERPKPCNCRHTLSFVTPDEAERYMDQALKYFDNLPEETRKQYRDLGQKFFDKAVKFCGEKNEDKL